MTKRLNNTVVLVGASMLALALVWVPAALAGGLASSTGQVSLVIRPAASLQQSGDTVRLQVRLTQGATASVWTTDESCSVPSPTARTILRSGTYDIPNSELGSGNRVCLASSDGSLRISDQRSSASIGGSF